MPLSNDVRERVLKAIDPDEVVNLTSQLVKFPSECESPGAEVEISRFVVDYLKKMGLEVTVHDVPPGGANAHAPPGPHPQILARLKGSGGGVSMLMGGHIDTEPLVHRERWVHDPFSGDIDRKEGWIYGLGTVNMKQSEASFISAIHAIIRSNVKLKGDLYFAGFVMEDINCIGSKYMVAHWNEFNFGKFPDTVLIGEPTALSGVTTHTGSSRLTLITEGRLAHPSSRYVRRKEYEGRKQINAFEKMLKIIEPLKDVRRTFRYERHHYLGDPVVTIGDVRTKVAGKWRPILGSYECQMDIDCRYPPGMSGITVKEDIERLIHNLSGDDPELVARVELWEHFRPACELPRDHHLISTLRKAHKEILGEDLVVDIDTNGTSTDRFVDMWRLAGSDAGHFAAGGASGINYGPGYAPVAADERININDLVNHCKVSTLTAAETCSMPK